MKAHSEPRNPIPNPRGTQTVPQPKPATPRSPDGRFAPEFHPHPPQTRVGAPGNPNESTILAATPMDRRL